MTSIMIAGAVVGVGLLLLGALLDRSGGRGVRGLARLDADRRRSGLEVSLTADRRQQGESARARRTGARVRQQLERSGLRLPRSLRADLAIIGRSLEAHISYSLLAAGFGFLFPVVLWAVVTLIGGGGVSVVPLAIGLVGAGLGLLVPSLVVVSQANDRRRDFRHVVGSFLDLVAMNLAGGRGIPEALQSASSISDTWGMVRIRDALEIARLSGATPWFALGALGEELQVDELRDLAAALTLVAEDGAKVRDSLTARAASMRQRELADAESRAQERSQSMLVAQLLLCVGFLLFLTYPALAAIAGS